MLDYDKIADKFPWLLEESKDMIIGNDLDGFMSGQLMNFLLGWKIRGLYVNSQTIWFDADLRQDELPRCVYVDIDVNRNHIASIGHHILKHSASDVLPNHQTSTFNPNLERNRYLKGRWEEKYPLGTVHLLMGFYCHRGYSIPLPTNDDYMSLLWHADSAALNAVKYFNNVMDLLSALLPRNTTRSPLHSLNDDLRKTTVHEFSRRLNRFFDTLASEPYNYTRGQQPTITNPLDSTEMSKLRSLRQLIQKSTGWGSHPAALPKQWICSHLPTERRNTMTEMVVTPDEIEQVLLEVGAPLADDEQRMVVKAYLKERGLTLEEIDNYLKGLCPHIDGPDGMIFWLGGVWAGLRRRNPP